MSIVGDLWNIVMSLGIESIITFIVVTGLLYWQTGKTYITIVIGIAVAIIIGLII